MPQYRRLKSDGPAASKVPLADFKFCKGCDHHRPELVKNDLCRDCAMTADFSNLVCFYCDVKIVTDLDFDYHKDKQCQRGDR